MFLLPHFPRWPTSLIFTCPPNYSTLMKFPVFLIPILWDVKERRAADRRRPEHTTVNTSKLVFPLLFRTAARHSSGDIEELHAGQRHTLSGVWSVPLLGFKPQGVCSVRPHYSVCAPAGIQTPRRLVCAAPLQRLCPCWDSNPSF